MGAFQIPVVAISEDYSASLAAVTLLFPRADFASCLFPLYHVGIISYRHVGIDVRFRHQTERIIPPDMGWHVPVGGNPPRSYGVDGSGHRSGRRFTCWGGHLLVRFQASATTAAQINDSKNSEFNEASS